MEVQLARGWEPPVVLYLDHLILQTILQGMSPEHLRSAACVSRSWKVVAGVSWT